MTDRIYGTGQKYTVLPGIDFYTQEYDSHSGICAVPGEVSILEISWCRRGRMECRMKDGCILYMGEGDIFLSMTDNHASHLEFPLGYYSGVAVSVNASLADENLPATYKAAGISTESLTKKFFRNDDCFLFKSSPLTENFFSAVYDSSHVTRELYITLKTLELMLFLSELDPSAGSPMTFYRKSQTDLIKSVQQYIRQDPAMRHSIDSLAERFCISATSLKSAFKDIYGLPIATYMKKVRLDKAAEFLLESDAAVGEVANSVGYESPSKFSAAFKDYHGITPAEYRKKHTKRSESRPPVEPVACTAPIRGKYRLHP